MSIDKFSEILKDKTDEELQIYLDQPERFQPEAIEAARLELEQRGVTSENNTPEFSISKANLPQRPLENTQENHDTYNQLYFPRKPYEVAKEKSMTGSFISLAIYLALAHFALGWDWRFIMIVTMIVIIHELGHYTAMIAYNYKNVSIFFLPLVGAFASGEKERISQFQEIIVLFAGPLPGIVIGCILYAIGYNDPTSLSYECARVFLFLNLFNLLPITPLDGGQILQRIFLDREGILDRLFSVISIIVLVGITIWFKSYILLIIPIFLSLRLFTIPKINAIKRNLKKLSINTDQPYSEISDRDYWIARSELVQTLSKYKNVSPTTFHESPEEQLIINDLKGIFTVNPTQDLGIFGKVSMTIFYIATIVLPVLAVIFIQTLMSLL